MKVKKKKYLIIYHTQRDNGDIDERQMLVKNKYNAKDIYNELASKNSTINIDLVELS